MVDLQEGLTKLILQSEYQLHPGHLNFIADLLSHPNCEHSEILIKSVLYPLKSLLTVLQNDTNHSSKMMISEKSLELLRVKRNKTMQLGLVEVRLQTEECCAIIPPIRKKKHNWLYFNIEKQVFWKIWECDTNSQWNNKTKVKFLKKIIFQVCILHFGSQIDRMWFENK